MHYQLLLYKAINQIKIINAQEFKIYYRILRSGGYPFNCKGTVHILVKSTPGSEKQDC